VWGNSCTNFGIQALVEWRQHKHGDYANPPVTQAESHRVLVMWGPEADPGGA